MRGRPLQVWLKLLAEADVPASPVAESHDLPTDPHLYARGMVVAAQDDGSGIGGVRFVRLPLQFPGMEYDVSVFPPTLGEHTHEILDELGYGLEARGRLVKAGVIAPATPI